MPYVPDSTERTRWRNNIGDTGSPPAYTDPEIDEKFAEASEYYPSGNKRVMMAEAVLLGIRNLLADSARLVSYVANASSEQKSDVSRHLKDLYAIYQAELSQALSQKSGGGVMFGSTKAHPSRSEEYPDA